MESFPELQTQDGNGMESEIDMTPIDPQPMPSNQGDGTGADGANSDNMTDEQ